MRANLDGSDLTFLIGKKIVKAEEIYGNGWENADGYLLTCEDGTEIEIRGNVGCGGCDNGWSTVPSFAKLVSIDNAIADIKVEYTKSPWGYDEDCFKMFIIYDGGLTVELEGSDGYGNGYYGGGFWVDVKEIK